MNDICIEKSHTENSEVKCIKKSNLPVFTINLRLFSIKLLFILSFRVTFKFLARLGAGTIVANKIRKNFLRQQMVAAAPQATEHTELLYTSSTRTNSCVDTVVDCTPAFQYSTAGR